MDEPTPPTDATVPGSLPTQIVGDMLTRLAAHPNIPAALLTALQTHDNQSLLTSADALQDAIRSATKGPAR